MAYDGTPGLGGYFIDDCVCVVVRAYVTAFPEMFGNVDLGMISPVRDRAAWLLAMMSAFPKGACRKLPALTVR